MFNRRTLRSKVVVVKARTTNLRAKLLEPQTKGRLGKVVVMLKLWRIKMDRFRTRLFVLVREDEKLDTDVKYSWCSSGVP